MAKLNQLTETYEIYEKLNAGGGGTIYRAFHKRLKKDVIIKVMHRYLKDTLNRRAEADILKKLRHTYLPQVLDYFEEDGMIVTVMDYIPGKSFQQLLDEGKRFKQRYVIKWAIQLCEALDYLHSQNPTIIHSDIKPGNIMLLPSGDICLIDFNISSFYEKDGAHVYGFSNGYSPPEQYKFYQINKKGKKQISTVPTEKVQSNGSSGIKNEANADILRNREQEANANDDKTEILKTGEFVNEVAEDKTEILGGIVQDKEDTYDGTEILGVQEPKNELLEDRTEIIGIREQGDEGTYDGIESFHNREDDFDNGTEILGARKHIDISDNTEILDIHEVYFENSDKTELNAYAIVNERSDIYSLGATLYHILTGVCPAKSTDNIKSITDYGKFTDGLIYIISKAMQKKPQKRFLSAERMLKALNSINRLDRRYKSFILHRQLTFIIIIALYTGSILSVYFGHITMKQEKYDEYQRSVEVMSNYRKNDNFEELDKTFSDAVSLFPERVEAYYEKALALYEASNYNDAIIFIESTILENHDIITGDYKGDIYYLLGNCYFEKGDYEFASMYFKKAINLNEDNISYYADYAVALAKHGDSEGAKEVLNNVMEKDITDAVVYRIKGEIDLIDRNYESGEQNFLNCIQIAEDDYTRMRAYLSCSQIYDDARAEQIDNWESPGINGTNEDILNRQLLLLKDAKARLPISMTISILENLAQANLNCSLKYKNETYLLDAISVFNEIVSMNWDTYLTHKNLVNIYRQLGDLDSAWKEAELMLNEYGEDYYIYSLLALIECDRQIGKEHSERDFNQFIEYYNKSVHLYKEQLKNNTDSQEMIPLFDAYDLLIERGWITRE